MTKRSISSFKGDIILLIAAFSFGSGLVAQKAGMDNLGPFAFSGLRFIIGGIALMIISSILNHNKTNEQRNSEMSFKEMLPGCIACGIITLVGVTAQQYGLPLTTVGKTGFITGLYVIMTPLFAAVILKRKVMPRIWVAALISVTGFYFLSMNGGFESLNLGDGLMLITALCCTLYVFLLEYFAARADAIRFTAIQFILIGIICLPFAFAIENTTLTDVINTFWPLIYAGLGVSAFGYTFQMIGQKYVDASRATVILSSETIFSLLSGMVFYHEVLNGREFFGCALMFTAIILAETVKEPDINEFKEKHSKNEHKTIT